MQKEGFEQNAHDIAVLLYRGYTSSNDKKKMEKKKKKQFMS